MADLYGAANVSRSRDGEVIAWLWRIWRNLQRLDFYNVCDTACRKRRLARLARWPDRENTHRSQTKTKSLNYVDLTAQVAFARQEKDLKKRIGRGMRLTDRLKGCGSW